MEIVLEVWSSDYAQVKRTCRAADAAGIDGFVYGESPHGLNLDCWTTLAALAEATRRIRLGPVITNVLPSYRSLLLLARQAATVAAIAPGRVDFRTGVGAAAPFARPWWEPRGIAYPSYRQRLDDLIAALEWLPALWSEVGVDVPITVAASGDRAMAVAARHAQVWETSFCTPADYAERVARFDTLGDQRPKRSLEIDGFVGTSDASVRATLERVHADRGRSENLAPILERALTGTPDAIAEQLAELESVGVEQVVVALHDPHDLDAIEALAAAR